MKKGLKLNRMLSVVLSLCLLLSTCVLGTGTALAADEPQDFVVEHDHNHEGWTPLNEVTTAVQDIPDGNYYLENDMKLTDYFYSVKDSDVTICLNGHTLTVGDSSIRVHTNATLTVTDCADKGVITGSETTPIRVYGTFILENGSISGNTSEAEGGAVYVDGGTFIMKNGTISDNIAPTSNAGGICVLDGSFIMEGGTISGNTSAFYGGGVYVANSSFTMKGGTISDNTARIDGGGVRLWSTDFIMEGGSISRNKIIEGDGGGIYAAYSDVFTIKGGEISDNYAKAGGGVCLWYTHFTMESGKISGNLASAGGGAYIRYTDFLMKGGEISENTARTNGGGIFTHSGGIITMENGIISGNTAGIDGGGIVANNAFIVSGSPVVAGNTLTDETTQSNVCFGLGVACVDVKGKLTDGAKLGINRNKEDEKETPVLTQGYSDYHTDDAGKYFFYDNAESYGNCDVGTGPDGEAWFGYNVTYKDTSGNTLEEQFVGYNCTATPRPLNSDDNYWSTEIGGEKFDFDAPITENLSLYSAFEAMLVSMSPQIRFQRNEDGSYANKFDIRTRAEITDEDFAKYIAETNEVAVKKISKVGFVYSKNSTDFSIADAQKVAMGEKVSGYVDAPVNYIQDADGYYMFTCIITDIHDEDIQESVTAYAYICVGDKWYFYNTETTVIFKDLYETNYPKAAKAYGW